MIFVDFETRSRADLDTIGGRLYAEHPTTDVLCAVVRFGDGSYCEYTGLGQGEIVDEIEWWFDREGWAACAHNAIGFDRHVWRRLGWPEPRKWVDTAELARVAGYPQASLEWLGENLLGRPKDLEGNALTLTLSTPDLYYGAALAERVERAKLAWKETNKGRLPAARIKSAIVAQLDALPDSLRPPPAPVDPATIERVVQYCRADVELMVELWDHDLGAWLDSDLPGLEEADRAVNDRGVLFDSELAQILLAADDYMRQEALEAAGVATSAEVGPAQLKAKLAALGITIEDCTADTLGETLRGLDAESQAAKLIRARQAQSTIAAGKLRAGLACVSPDGRLRDNTRYMGAHTGRWSGQKMQLQNTAGGDLLDVEATIARLREGYLEAVHLVEAK